MSAADTIRRAAAVMRERAEKATPGPWIDSGRYGAVIAPELPAPAGCDEYGGAVVGESIDPADREYLVPLAPEFLVAVAELLELEADRDDEQPWTDDVTKRAEALAEQYLGQP